MFLLKYFLVFYLLKLLKPILLSFETAIPLNLSTRNLWYQVQINDNKYGTELYYLNPKPDFIRKYIAVTHIE